MNYSYIKRGIDVVVSGFILLLLAPFMVLLSVLNVIVHGRPIFFKQKRPGLHGRPFDMYKFRTMTNQKDKDGNLLPDHERLTGFGRFLRKTSLDELPELYNVLTGDMSLVGPRPLLMKYLPWYTDREQARHRVRPGLTGLSQVEGRNNLGWDDRLEKDLEYVENVSLLMDLKILLKTVAIVFQGKNVELNAIEDLDIYRKKRSDIKVSDHE